MFTIIGSKVFHYDVEVKGANAATFVPLNNTWGKDDKNAFCNSSVRRVKDPSTFEALNEAYARDKFHIYLPTVTLEKADRDSFIVLDPGTASWSEMVLAGGHPLAGYAKDKNSVYFMNVTVRGADPNSFQSLRNRFGLDANNVFYEGKNLHVKDIASWRPIAGSLSCDRVAVYRYSKLVQGADPRTVWLLPPLEGGWFRDHAAFYSSYTPTGAQSYFEAFQLTLAHHNEMLRLFQAGDYFSRQFRRAVPMDVSISDEGDCT